MNKLAAMEGLTVASEQHAFRQKHPICLKHGEAVKKPPPPLPSDLDSAFVYGMPATHRTAEQVRNAGKFDPPTKALIQGQFMNSWVEMNTQRANEFDKRRIYIPPRGTVATLGHAEGAKSSLMRCQGAIWLRHEIYSADKRTLDGRLKVLAINRFPTLLIVWQFEDWHRLPMQLLRKAGGFFSAKIAFNALCMFSFRYGR
jgi:hypothetical protein